MEQRLEQLIGKSSKMDSSLPLGRMDDLQTKGSFYISFSTNQRCCKILRTIFDEVACNFLLLICDIKRADARRGEWDKEIGIPQRPSIGFKHFWDGVEYKAIRFWFRNCIHMHRWRWGKSWSFVLIDEDDGDVHGDLVPSTTTTTTTGAAQRRQQCYE